MAFYVVHFFVYLFYFLTKVDMGVSWPSFTEKCYDEKIGWKYDQTAHHSDKHLMEREPGIVSELVS